MPSKKEEKITLHDIVYSKYFNIDLQLLTRKIIVEGNLRSWVKEIIPILTDTEKYIVEVAKILKKESSLSASQREVLLSLFLIACRSTKKQIEKEINSPKKENLLLLKKEK